MSRWRVPVLMYHAVCPERSPITISAGEFAWQMRWLADEGYQVIALQTLLRSILGGTPPPERSLVITFDDGLESLYTDVLPLLEGFGFPATVFLVSGHCGGSNDWERQPGSIPLMPMLSWEQIREMDVKGVDFGAHTIDHQRLIQQSDQEVERQILGSKEMIERKLGHEVDLFAYPYGQLDNRVKCIVRKAFIGACGTKLGFADENSDPFEIERVDIHYFKQRYLFRELSSPAGLLYLSLRRPLRAIRTALYP